MTLSTAFDFSNWFRSAVCDRGGGVPKAALIWLMILYLPCLLHVLDTEQKWALVLVNKSSNASQMSKAYDLLPGPFKSLVRDLVSFGQRTVL